MLIVSKLSKPEHRPVPHCHKAGKREDRARQQTTAAQTRQKHRQANLRLGQRGGQQQWEECAGSNHGLTTRTVRMPAPIRKSEEDKELGVAVTREPEESEQRRTDSPEKSSGQFWLQSTTKGNERAAQQ